MGQKDIDCTWCDSYDRFGEVKSTKEGNKAIPKCRYNGCLKSLKPCELFQHTYYGLFGMGINYYLTLDGKEFTRLTQREQKELEKIKWDKKENSG